MICLHKGWTVLHICSTIIQTNRLPLKKLKNEKTHYADSSFRYDDCSSNRTDCK